MFSVLLLPVEPLRAPGLLEVETDGVLLPIELPMREVRPVELPTLEILPELAAGCPAPVGVEGLRVPIELPMRDLDVPRPEFERLLELAAGCLAAVEPDGLSIRIELLVPGREPGAGLSIRIELLPPGREPGAGLSIRIERPILDLVLVVGRSGDEETDGLRVVIELPMLALLPGLIRMLELLLIEVEPVELLPTEMLDEGLR